jgi:hypothetical protein
MPYNGLGRLVVFPKRQSLLRALQPLASSFCEFKRQPVLKSGDWNRPGQSLLQRIIDLSSCRQAKALFLRRYVGDSRRLHIYATRCKRDAATGNGCRQVEPPPGKAFMESGVGDLLTGAESTRGTLPGGWFNVQAAATRTRHPVTSR